MAKDTSDRSQNGTGHSGRSGNNGTSNPPPSAGNTGETPNGKNANTGGDASKNKPIHEIRMGRICGAIWPQQNGDGQTWHNVTLSRIYRDQGGHWQRSDSFGRTDLPLVMKVADQCHSWIYQHGQNQDE